MSPLPLYLQIASSIEKQIQSGKLSVDDRLPSERELAEELSVSRMTVRHALRTLQEQGLIDRLSGRGSFVSKPRVDQPVDVLVGLFDSMTRKGVRPSARLLAFEYRLADRQVAQGLQVEVGEPICFVHRLRLGNKLPLAVERAFFPAYCFPNPPDCQDLERRSLYAILREEAGINLEQAVQSLESRAAQPDEAKLLDISVGTPLMFVERVSYDDKQRVIEYGTYFFRGDCVRFVSHSTKPDW